MSPANYPQLVPVKRLRSEVEDFNSDDSDSSESIDEDEYLNLNERGNSLKI